MKLKPVFAIDAGGVLANKQHEGAPMEGAHEALWRLSALYDLHLVSQCGQQRRLDTAMWLATHDLPIPPEKQHYVSFKEFKAPVLERIDARYFVDDRMKHVRPALEVPRLIRVFHFAPGFDDVFGEPSDHPKYVRVGDWKEILPLVSDYDKIA